MLKDIEKQIYEINNKSQSLKWEKEKLQEQAEQELIKQFSEMIKNDTNGLTDLLLSNFATSLKALYR